MTDDRQEFIAQLREQYGQDLGDEEAIAAWERDNNWSFHVSNPLAIRRQLKYMPERLSGHVSNGQLAREVWCRSSSWVFLGIIWLILVCLYIEFVLK